MRERYQFAACSSRRCCREDASAARYACAVATLAADKVATGCGGVGVSVNGRDASRALWPHAAKNTNMPSATCVPNRANAGDRVRLARCSSPTHRAPASFVSAFIANIVLSVCQQRPHSTSMWHTKPLPHLAVYGGCDCLALQWRSGAYDATRTRLDRVVTAAPVWRRAHDHITGQNVRRLSMATQDCLLQCQCGHQRSHLSESPPDNA